MANEYRTLDLQEAARFLRMHPESLRRRAVAGEIPCAKPGRSWVFLERDLAEWLRAQYRRPRQASQGEGGYSCHLSDEGRKVSGGCGLPHPTDSEYSKVLKLPTGGRPRSTRHG